MKGIRRTQKLLSLVFVSLVGFGCASARYVPTRPVPNERQGFLERISSSKSKKDIHIAQAAPIPATVPIPEDAPAKSSKATKGTPAARVKTPETVAIPSRVTRHQILSAGGYSWPLRDVKITSPFGKRGREFHEGLDLRAPDGTPVYAAQSGVVLYAESRIRGYGQMVVIRHPGMIATIYAHNSKVLVKRGQRVKQGEQIAISGSTGHVRGPHVHFEIRKGVAAVNPMKFLSRPPKLTAFNRP